jgi:hypothetical protein
MKRTTKKLSLKSETLRSLSNTEMGEAAGGALVIVKPPIIIVQSRLIACVPLPTRACPGPSLVDGCPSALGCPISTVINPGY